MTIRTVLLNPHLHEWWGNTNHEPKDIYPGRMKVDAPPGYCFKLTQIAGGRWVALFTAPQKGDIFLSGKGEAIKTYGNPGSPRFILLPLPTVQSVSGGLECYTTVKDIYKKDRVDIPYGYALESFGLIPKPAKPPYYYLDTKEVVRDTDNPAGFIIPKIWLTKLPEPKACCACGGKGYLFDTVNLQVLLCNDCDIFSSPAEAKQAFISDLK